MTHPSLKKAVISDSLLVNIEFSENYIKQIREVVFKVQLESFPRPEGSQFEQWFRRVTQGPNAIRSPSTNDRMHSRLISWKTGKDFVAENIFFRTVDTSRLLPMALAAFRIQWYVHPQTWKLLEEKKQKDTEKPGDKYLLQNSTGMMFELLVMRNMHDYAGGDIPIILTTWGTEELDTAFEYWTELSKGQWSDEQRVQKYDQCCSRFCLRLLPCFPQADFLVRSLLSDPEVGYVPRFIVFFSTLSKSRGRALFIDPSFCPPPALTETYPTTCGSAGCTDSECGFFDFTACRSLMGGTQLVRKDEFPQKIIRCNFWICTVEEPFGFKGPSVFQTCQRCKEVLYCSKEHQAMDWRSHKKVCEALSTSPLS